MTPAGDRAWTLPAAAGFAAVETTLLFAVLGFRGDLRAPLVIAFLAVKYPFCWQLLRRRPGAFFGVVLWEVAGVLAALGARDVPLWLRSLELALAGGVLALLLASIPLFPTVRLPDR